MMIARGHWQAEIWRDLEKGEVVDSPFRFLRGRATKYQARYQESFANLLERAEKAGYVIGRIPGVRGGEYTAQYMVIARPQEG